MHTLLWSATVLVRWRSYANCLNPTATLPQNVTIGYPSTVSKPPFSYCSFIYCQISWITVMPFNSTGYATDPNVLRIAESRVPSDHLKSVLPIHTPISCCTCLTPPTRRIALCKIPIRHREAAAMEPQDTVGEPDDCNAFLPLLTCTRPETITLA